MTPNYANPDRLAVRQRVLVRSPRSAFDNKMGVVSDVWHGLEGSTYRVRIDGVHIDLSFGRSELVIAPKEARR